MTGLMFQIKWMRNHGPIVKDRQSRSYCHQLEMTTKLQKENKDHEVGSQDNIEKSLILPTGRQ